MSPSSTERALIAGLGACWRAVACATGPAARAPVERAVRVLYRRAGLPEPRAIVWAAGPLEGALGAYLARSAPVRAAVCADLSLVAQAQVERRLDAPRALAALGEDLCVLATRLLRAEIAARPDPAAGDRMFARARREWGVTDLAAPPWPLVWPEVAAATYACAQGQHEAHRVGLLELGLRSERGRAAAPAVEAHAEVARGSGWWWPCATVCILTERPLVVSTDDEGRLHGDGAPALVYGDQLVAYAVHGAGLAAAEVAERNRRAVAALVSERNVEIRRLMLERFGMGQLVRMGFAQRIDSDDGRALYRITVPGRVPLAVVQVSCPSTGREYLLAVPPWIARCQDAVAWTFGLRPHEYTPIQET